MMDEKTKQIIELTSAQTSLNSLAEAAQALITATDEIEAAELKLKEVKEKARVLKEETIPSAMQEMGLKELRLETGQQIAIKQEVYASIPEENADEAFGWLEENGHDGIIKSQVFVSFGKGENPLAEKLMELLFENDYKAEQKRGVHPQTLKAFLREQMSEGTNVPLELFGARAVFTAKITKA